MRVRARPSEGEVVNRRPECEGRDGGREEREREFTSGPLPHPSPPCNGRSTVINKAPSTQMCTPELLFPCRSFENDTTEDVRNPRVVNHSIKTPLVALQLRR